MSTSESSNLIINLRDKIEQLFDEEPNLLRLLHETIEIMDQTNQPENQKQFVTHIVPQLIKILKQKGPSFKDDVRHKVRQSALEVLHMIPFSENIGPSEQLVSIYVNVMMTDNEENAEISLKTLIEMQKYYKTVYEILATQPTGGPNQEDKFQQFMDFCKHLFRNMPTNVEKIKLPPDEQQRGNVQLDAPLRRSVDSLKSIPHCCHYLLLINQMFEDKAKRLIETLLPLLIDSVSNFPDNILQEVKNMPLYIEYLETLKNVLSFFTFLLKKHFTQTVINRLDKILEIQIKILKNIPPQATIIRRDILHMIKYQINEIQGLEKNDQQNNGGKNKDLFEKNKEIYKNYINDLMSMSVLCGQGKLSKELYYYTITLAYTFINYMKDLMNIDQIKKSIQLITKNMLDPQVALNLTNTLIFVLYRLYLEIIKKRQNNEKSQLEILESLIIFYKDLRFALKQIEIDFNSNKQQEQQKLPTIKWMQDIEQKELPKKELFALEDQCFLESTIQINQNGTQQGEPLQGGDLLENQKDTCSKIVKNLVSCVETVINATRESQNQKYVTPQELKLLKKLLIHGSYVIQHLHDLIPNEKEKINEIIKKFATIFQELKPLQFRDLFYSVQDEFFPLVIEIRATKGEVGVVLLADSFMYLTPLQQQQRDRPQKKEDHTYYFLEIFFEYIVKKMKLLNKQIPISKQRLVFNEQERRLLDISSQELNDALQKIIHTIGTSEIVPYFFWIIRNLFKELCNLSDVNTFVKEFIPTIQGLLETFLQAREEASYIKETNEICYTIPAKLKNLIEYLPIISKPLLESMKSHSIELIESGINSIQLWVSALASYPEILDPVISQILPELNLMLYRILYMLPNYAFKLLGKLGAKTRLYYQDKEFKSKNLQVFDKLTQYSPEDGLKIELEDRHSTKKVVLSIDIAIDVCLLKIFDNFQKYSSQQLIEAFKLVKCSFLCFIDTDIDMNYLIASIASIKNKRRQGTGGNLSESQAKALRKQLLIQYSQNSSKFFDSKKPQMRISSSGKGCENHAFEKILKSLLIACSLPKNNPDTEKLNKKVKDFLIWVTQYFTLVYICKNGKLKQNLVDEINPLLFLENICDFLYYNMLQGSIKSPQRSYFKGSMIALKTMFKMIGNIFGEDNSQVFNELEFLTILIQKICHLCYGQDLPKKVAANQALQKIIKGLPSGTIKFHRTVILDSIFHVLCNNQEALIYKVEEECRNTLDLFFEKIGIYENDFMDSINEEDQAVVQYVFDKLLRNLEVNRRSARTVSMHYLEKLSSKSGKSIGDILKMFTKQDGPINQNNVPQPIIWETFLVEHMIEKRIKHFFQMYKGGYSSILNLMAYLDLVQFLIKHSVINLEEKRYIYLILCEYLIKILIDETEIYEKKVDASQNFYQEQQVSQTAKSAVKYMKMEKHYLQYNKVHDSYSHTLHPHHFLSKQHFEVEEQTKREKLRQEFEKIKFTYIDGYDLIPQQQVNLDPVNIKAFEKFGQDHSLSYINETNKRINAFIGELFKPAIRVSEISYDYINHFYELYPNHRLHTELICQCLTLLCDISTHNQMHMFLKERQQAFFDLLQSAQQSSSSDQKANNQFTVLNCSFDFYAVFIKSQIIALYFKLFQREEKNIQKAAKRCLARILKREVNQQEALPNQILKECVRPSLNILSSRPSHPQLFKHLTSLISVLHACFNDQLGRHLTKSYETFKRQIQEPYNISPEFLAQAQEASLGADGQPNSQNQNEIGNEFQKIVYTYNQKIEHLEISNNIIQILYLLPTSRDTLSQQIIQKIPEFERDVCKDLEEQFWEKIEVLSRSNPRVKKECEEVLRPLNIKLGILKSDFRRGLSKFFNKNTYDAGIAVFNGPAENELLRKAILEILAEPDSYCLRERLSRETEGLKQCLQKTNPGELTSAESELALKIITIFIKKIPNYLVQPQNYSIVHHLKEKWIELSRYNLDRFQNQSNLINLRKQYTKIQRCLLSYCEHPKANMSVFFDLIKGYKYQSLIDQTSIKLFFAKKIPETFSTEKKIDLMRLALDKINRAKDEESEQKYMFFELGFMPIIIHHSEDPEFFSELVNSKILEQFFQTFFIFQLKQMENGPQRLSITQLIKSELETSYSISYESFHIEIIKVLNLFLDYFPNYQSFSANLYSEFDCKPINHFLNQCAKRASNSILKEWAFYTTTLLYCKILEDQNPDKSYIKMTIEGAESILMLLLQHSQNLHSKALVQKSFSNVIKIMSSPSVLSLQSDKKDYVSICMKRALNFEGRHTSSLIYLCNFIIAHEEFFYLYNQTFQNKLFKVINKFTQQYQPNIVSRQLTVEIAQVLINWSEKSINNISSNAIENQSNVKNQYMQFNSQILYQLIRTSIMLHGSHPESPLKDILEISTKCLQLIKKIIFLHNNMKIQFPIFNKLLQNDNDERENISLIRMILLNVSQILIQHQQESQDFKKFFLEFICNIKTRYYKCILFSTKIIREIVFMSSETDFSQQIAERINKILIENVRTCQDQSLDKVCADINQIEQKYLKNNQQPYHAFQDVSKCIFPIIPHFTIRLISKIDQDLEKDPQFKFTHLYQFNSFEFVKDMAQCLFKIVMNFRKHIVFDQNEMIKYKGLVNVQEVKANTQYTPDELIILKDEIVELKPEEPNYDLFNKESIMMGLLIIAKKLKTMDQIQAIQIFDLLQHMMTALFKFNNNEYIVEWLRKIVDVLINDKTGDTTRLQLDKKCQKILTLSDFTSQNANLQLNSIFEQCVNFLEKQPTLFLDNTNKIFEKAFISTQKKPPALKQRLFSIYEKFNGTSLFSKLKFFFTKHQIDDVDKQQFFTAQSQLLDFTLYNFKTDIPLSKTKNSSRLFPLNNPCLEIDASQVANYMDDHDNEFTNLTNILQPLTRKVNKYKNLQLRDLMDPLSEIININPSHTQDKQLSDKLFIKIFWQYWNIMNREEQQFLTDCINKYFLRCIPSGNQQVDKTHPHEKAKKQQTKLFLEAIAATSPQIRIDPEILQLIGKTQNLWHVCIPIVENHILIFPQNERYVFALNELYNKLMEEDYLAGLRRSVTDSKETRSMISYGQHHKWEEINQQFSYFIDYYAEQEGLYAQMDREQEIPGKYSCQISKDFIHKSIVQHERQKLSQMSNEDQAKQQQNHIQQIENVYPNPFSDPEHLQQLSSNNFPKDGPNKFVKEIDLRIWETLFIDSVKILNRWEQYRDIAHTMQNQEMWIEFFWNIKKWEELKYFEKTLSESDSIQYQLYYIYYIIQSKRQNEFDAIFKKVISSSYQQWDSQCPNYIDNIQFENLIMYQLVMESSEGGRNMIKEAENLRHKNKMSEIKTAINIWRERVPHQCERIQMWKEVLENRNFIYEQISEIIAPNLRTNVSGGQEQDNHIKVLNEQRKQFVNELLDKTWNWAKLAQVSRKQGLPTLCLHYLQAAKKIFENSPPDTFKQEKFKCEYELLKLQMNYNQLNPSMQTDVEKMRLSIEENKSYDSNQKAEFYRLFGEHYLYLGSLKEAQSHLTRSLELNKKEAKTWMSYAKLNETVFNELKDEKAIFNALRGYLSATVLNLHKSRLIIPYVLRLLRRRDVANQQPISMMTLQKLMKNYIDQMPTWIWLFWIPQLINFLFAHQQLPEFNFAKYVLYKMSKLYPQAVIYSLKFKQSMSKTGEHGQAHENANNMISELLKIVKNTTPIATSLILQIGKELVEKIKLSPEEELQILLGKILQFNQFFSSESIESDFKSFLDHVYRKFFKEEILSKSKLLRSINTKFFNDFINPQTSEKDILTLITKLKNFKDFIQKKLSLSVMQTNLEEISPFLANFNERGVELPGQYMIIDSVLLFPFILLGTTT